MTREPDLSDRLATLPGVAFALVMLAKRFELL